MADMTLDDLTLEMMEANQNLVQLDGKLSMANTYLNDVNANSWASFEVLNSILEVMTGNNLAALEKAKEDGAMQQRILDTLENIDGNTKKEKKVKELDTDIGPLKYILAIGGLLSGLVAGFALTQLKMMKWFTSKLWGGIRFLGNGIAKLFMNSLKLFQETRFGRALTDIVLNIKTFFRNLGTTVKTAITENSLVKYIQTTIKNIKASFFNAISGWKKEFTIWGEFFRSIGSKVGAFFKPILDGVRLFLTSGAGAAETGNMLSKIGAWFGKIKTAIANFIKPIMTFARSALGVFRTFAKVGLFIGGKLLAPLITAFDVVMGAIDGFKKDGLVGGIIGAIKGFFKQFGELGNIIKDIVSWIAKKLGFDGFSKWLDSIDIAKMINDAIDGIANFFKGIFKDPVGTLKGVWESMLNLGSMIGEALGKAWKWLKGLFGFKSEEAKAEGEDTSGGFMGIVTGAFSSAWNWVKGLFSFTPEEANAKGVFSKLIDIIMAPLNLAINWIKGLFGWGDPEKPFSLGTFITDTVKKVWDWIKSLFTWSPEAKKEEGSDDKGKETSLFGIISKALQRVWEYIKGLFTNIDFSAIAKAILPESLSKLADKVANFFSGDKKDGGTGTSVTIPSSATPEDKLGAIGKIANNTGDKLNAAASETANTKAVNDAKTTVAVQQSAQGGGGGSGVSMNNSSDNSTINISGGHMPDRTEGLAMGA